MPVKHVSGNLPLLDGCRVLDLADEKGAYCGRVLADFGADVIALEPPQGNHARQIGPFFQDQADREKSLFWFYVAANKRSITLELETAEGRETLRRLVNWADIVIDSHPPIRRESLGLDYGTLARQKPSIVMTSITPFGATGPYDDFVASDLVLAAMGGLVRMYGYLDSPPLRITPPQSFFHGGIQGAIGSVLAYYHAQWTGEGQLVDVSLQEAMVLTLMRATEIWELMGVNPRGNGPFQIQPRRPPEAPLLLRWVFPVADGFILLILGSGAQAGMAASTRKLVQLANAEGFALGYADYAWECVDLAAWRQEDADAIFGALGAWFQTKTKVQLFQCALRHGLLVAPVNTFADLAASPQLAYRDFWTTVDHPELGEALIYPGPALKIGDAPPGIHRRAPLLGEHNDEVLRELTG